MLSVICTLWTAIQSNAGHLLLVGLTTSFYRIEFRSISICSLPRETKVVLSLYGVAGVSSADIELKSTETSSVPVLLGWNSFFLFDCDWDISASATCHLVQGDEIIGLWRTEPVFVEGPALSGVADVAAPLLWIVLPQYDDEIIFPAVLHSSSYAIKKDFENLDEHTQEKIQDILSRDVLQQISTVEKELIWEKRHYLHSCSNALPRIFESAFGWDW